jgi:hypothetical protein
MHCTAVLIPGGFFMPHSETANWLEVHGRFVHGDTAAWEAIAEHFLERLSQRFFRLHPDVDRNLIIESVEDALLDYQKCPQRFDATLGVPLDYWLFIRTRGHLSHLLRKEQAYHRHEQAIGIEEKKFAEIAIILSRKGLRNGYSLREEEQPDCSARERWLLAQFSPREHGVLILLQEKAPKEEWIQLLDLESLPPEQQVRQIDREKERIRKKRQRVRKKWRAIHGDMCHGAVRTNVSRD